MQTLSETINRKIQEKCFFHSEWKNMKFVNHGLGLMRYEEHEELIKLRAINCHGDYDAINCDYPKLVISLSTEEKVLDTKGDMVALLGEKSSLENKGTRCRIEYFPKAYADYYIRKKIADENKQNELVALEYLIKDFNTVKS